MHAECICFAVQSWGSRPLPERIAIKILSPSDLTFFDALYKQSNVGGNQKAINLNANVFAKILYPDFAARSLGQDEDDPISITVFEIGTPSRSDRVCKHVQISAIDV